MSHRPLVKIMKCDGGHLIVTGVLAHFDPAPDCHAHLEVGFQIFLVELGILGTPLPKHGHPTFTQLLHVSY